MRAFEAEGDHVYRALRRHGVRRQDAPDLVQEVFLIMWRRWGDFDPSRELRPWLAGIAFKVAHAHHRRFWRREIPTDVVEPASAGPAPDEELAQSRTREVALRALGRLPDKYRSVLVMHDIDGIPVREIAALAELPRFTVHTQLRRARARFEEIVRSLETSARQERGEGHAAFTPAGLLALERRPPRAPAEVWQRVRTWQSPPDVGPPFVPPARPAWPLLGGVVATLAVVGAVGGWHAHRPGAPVASRSTLPSPVTAPSPAPDPSSAPAQLALAVAEPGLSGHWSFDEASGGIARDLSGHGRDCRLHGLDPRAAWVAGHQGGALDLGKRGWLECPQPAVGFGPASLTVALWVKLERPRAISTIVDRHLGPGTESYVHFAQRGEDLQLWSAVWSHTTRHPLEAPLDGWVHLAFTHAGRTSRIFVDGSLAAQHDDTRPKNGDGVTTAPLVVGALVRGPDKVWQHLDAAIDDLRVYERALDVDEIAALADR